MPVYVFIIESANTETFTTEFLNREIYDLVDPQLNINMNLDSYDSMITEVSSKFKTNVVTIFVDQQYQIKYYYSNEGQKELEKLNKLKENSANHFKNANWHEFFVDFVGIDESFENHYIFATSKNFKDAYYMSNFLSLPFTLNSYYIWNVSDISQVVEAKSYYNVFSVIPKKLQLNSLGENVVVDSVSLNNLIKIAVIQTQSLMKAGFLKNEAFIQSWVDNWCLNPESIFIKGVILEYELTPKAPVDDSKILKGLTIREQFNESSQYRYDILDIMCRCLCKYGLEFGKIQTINNNPHTVNFDLLLN